VNWWILGAIVLGIPVLSYLAHRFRIIDLTGKNQSSSAGNGAGLIGIGDEVFAPARHEAAMELDRQTILPAPAPLAGDRDKGDRDKGVYDGRVTINLGDGN
jgi:hypothetical protein